MCFLYVVINIIIVLYQQLYFAVAYFSPAANWQPVQDVPSPPNIW